jgi:LuxR family transcriptional regulator, maltose regulon positive regulatory protein
MLQRRPDLGTLVGEVLALRDRLGSERGSTSPGASALTAAELFVSRTTVNTQVLSIYRKLGASSRNSAVGRARELGPLEG